MSACFENWIAILDLAGDLNVKPNKDGAPLILPPYFLFLE